MQFIADNYIWFLVIGIVVIMTVIGYIAEKTDFGHKEVNKPEKKDKKKLKELKKLEKSKLKLNDVVYSEDKNNIEVINVDNSDNLIEEDLTVPLNYNEKSDNDIKPIEEDLTVPLNGEKEETIDEKIEEDLTVPLNYNEKSDDDIKPIEEDLTVPLNYNSEKIDSENIKSGEDQKTSDELPKIPEDVEMEETEKDNTEVKSSDDIWKF